MDSKWRFWLASIAVIAPSVARATPPDSTPPNSADQNAPVVLAPMVATTLPTMPFAAVDDRSGVRARYGASIQGGFNLAQRAGIVGSGVGVDLRLGVQVGDLIGVEAEVSAGSLVLSDYVRAAVLLNVTPVDWITLSAGVVAGFSYCEGIGFDAGSLSETYAGGTTRVDLHVWHARTRSGRHAVTLGLAADLGPTIRESDVFAGADVVWGVYGNMGYTFY